jgi:hypothetical protein
MQFKARAAKVLLYQTAIITLACAAEGCGAKSAKLPTYTRPELLYLSGRPYSRLYIEVDTVQGVEVPDQWLDALEEFLSTHCSKPDGIKMVRDKPIPFEDIKDMPIGPASILCLDGPDPNSGSQPAYLHLFFYAKDKVFKKTTKSPHVLFPCPSAIFYNVDYGYRLNKMIKLTLPHEAGHVLGLCKNTEHSDGAHCRNKECLMRQSPDNLPSLGLLLFGSPFKSDLCDGCLSDLEAYKSESANPNLTFNGPFLIRKEDGYSVASLPYSDVLIPAALEDEFDWQKMLAKLKETIKETDFGEYWKKGAYRLWGLCRRDDTENPQESVIDYADVLTRATGDPSPLVKHVALAELKRLKQEQDKQ